ncbi:MAG: diguanylate cyclase, partial [Anaerolineales bacterium]|nr:diguanylate cyclase [Anaerolineales bacterium]
MEYLEDPTQTLNIEQVSSAEYQYRFIDGETDILNFGLTDSAYWLRFTVRNESQQEEHWLLELARPSMNSVFLYTPLSDGTGFLEKRTGYIFPVSTRDAPHENFVFRLDIPSGEEVTYYLRVKDISLDLPLRIWSTPAFEIHDQMSRLILALSFGALISMLIYNGILLFVLHDRGYIYYSFFQASLLLYLASIQGYTPRYIWPNSTLPNPFVIPLTIELAGIFQILFSWEFLYFKSTAKWMRHTRNMLVGVLIVSIPPTFFIGAKILILVLPILLVINLLSFLFGVWTMTQGYKPARYFLASWSIYIIIGISVILQHMGWITIEQLIPEQAFQLGAVYLITFQSLALADRIRYYKQENINAQNELIRQQEETLKVKDELNLALEDARIDLELRVAQRTRELIDTNAQLSEEINERKRVENELIRLANVDFLTGLYNRRYFFETAKREFDISSRHKLPLSVIIIDIDTFKKINDTYGHAVGDQALTHLGKLIQHITRKTDIAARYGGEEFTILLTQTDCASACALAERLRHLVVSSPIQVGGYSIQLTISIGVSGRDYIPADENLDQLISRADQALYKAKDDGRNRVVCQRNLLG